MKCATLLASIGAVILCTGVAAFAPLGGETFEIIRFTIDGGGGTSTGGAFALSGTIGQPDAGTGATGMAGGAFALNSGYWPSIGGGQGPTCPADLDNDDEVGFTDLLGVLSAWGACEACPADLDGDGFVAFPDLLATLAAWGPCD